MDALSASADPRPNYWVFIAKVDENAERCLLINDAYGRLMQVVLGLSALIVMFIKRQLETPMRPFRVWVLDVGKQCCGAMILHVFNIAVCVIYVAHGRATDDECGLYLISYLFDTTWGIAVLVALLYLGSVIAHRLQLKDLMESGYYGHPPRMRVFFKQLAMYCSAVLLLKILNSLVIWWFYASVATFATQLFSPFTSHRHLELVLVMIVIPGCLNAFQFWVVDSYVKCDGRHWKHISVFLPREEDGAEYTQPPLLGGAKVPSVVAPNAVQPVDYDTLKAEGVDQVLGPTEEGYAV